MSMGIGNLGAIARKIVSGGEDQGPKGIMGGAQKAVSAAGTQGSGEVHESTPDQEPTREARQEPSQTESFQERYNQDRFE